MMSQSAGRGKRKDKNSRPAPTYFPSKDSQLPDEELNNHFRILKGSQYISVLPLVVYRGTTMLFHIILLFTGIFLEDARAFPAQASVPEEDAPADDPRFKCLRGFGFPKGTEERLFRVVKCSPEHPVQVDCSPETLDKISNFTQEFPNPASVEPPEDFTYFVSSYEQMWAIASNGSTNFSRDDDGAVCWDVPAMEKILTEFQFLDTFYIWTSYYATTVIAVEVVFGLLANALVLTIYAKFKQMRTEPNMIILNLVISDTLLILNFSILSYVVYLLPVTIVLHRLCRPLVYIITFNSTCSVYSMVALSFLRYMAITALPGSKTLHIMRRYVKIPAVIVVVWLTSSMTSLPYMMDVNENCAIEFTPALQIFDFIFFCLLPLLLVAAFSFASRRQLRRSIKEIPGNKGAGMECEIWARERGAKVILALCIVFVITFFPPTLATLISTLTTIRYNYASYSHEMLFLLNTCVNPLALFISSGAFRKHFMLLLPKWLVKEPSDPNQETT